MDSLPDSPSQERAEPRFERLAKRYPWLRYWPLALFVLANAAAVALVVVAQRQPEQGPALGAPIRRPSEASLVSPGPTEPQGLDIDKAREVADVPAIFDWNQPPGAVQPVRLAGPPQRSMIERLAMGLGDLSTTATAAVRRDARRGTELALGIRPSDFGLGGLPPIGEPLLPTLGTPLIPPLDPIGLRPSILTPVELDPTTMSPEYLAKFVEALQKQGTPFHFKPGSQVAGIPPRPGSPSPIPGLITRPAGSPLPPLPGTITSSTTTPALPAPPTDLVPAPEPPRIRSDGRVRTVEPLPAPDESASQGEPSGPPAAPETGTPPQAAAEPVGQASFMSALLTDEAAAQAVADKLRGAGRAVNVQRFGPNYRVLCTVACRKSERSGVATRLSSDAGVAMRFAS